MPRSNWKGHISFGLVSIPIVLFPTENKSADISFHQIDKHNNARIKFQRINSVTGKKVEWDDIIKGYEYDKETMVPVPEEIIKKLAGENGRTIEIEQFINRKDLNLLAVNRTYYIVPDKKGDKGYVILREALNDTDKIGIAKVIISTKEYLAAIMPYEDKALVLYLLKYDDEIRKMNEFDIPTKDLSAYKVNKKEIDIAKQLIQSMTAKWKPEKFVDDYQATLHKWVEEEATRKPHKAAMKTRAKAQSNVVDFVELLKKSINSKSGAKKSASAKNTKSVKHIPKSKLKSAKHATRH
jgi:DNA end-binding protein Ku